MAAAAIQLIFLLYMLVLVTDGNSILKLVNSSVQLNTGKKADKSVELIWTFNKTKNIMKYNVGSPSQIFKSDKDRVEVNEESRSLTLKNLQKSDSGLYEAKQVDEDNTIVATYQLDVLDPVEKPVLNVSPQESNGTCIVTVSCGAQNRSITSYCYSNTCDMKEEKMSGDTLLSLSLYVSNSFIFCNHSNAVSWKNTTIEMKHVEQLCPSKEDKNWKTVGVEMIIIIIIAIATIFVIVSIIFVTYRHKKRETDSVNTVYEEVDPLKKGEKKEQTFEMSEKCPETAGTVYCTVGKPVQACSNGESTVSTENPGNQEIDPREWKPSDTILFDTPDQNQGPGNNYESVEFTSPQTIYATVNKAGKPV